MASSVTNYKKNGTDIGAYPAGGGAGQGDQDFGLKFTHNGNTYDIGRYFPPAWAGSRTVNDVNGNVGYQKNGTDISNLLCAEGYLNNNNNQNQNQDNNDGGDGCNDDDGGDCCGCSCGCGCG